MEVYECKPDNLPEDHFVDLTDNDVFVIDSDQELIKEHVKFFPIQHHRIGKRCRISTRYTWCGEHPRYWRELTDDEKLEYRK